jgi:methionine synthase II (cobalamin-independent)
MQIATEPIGSISRPPALIDAIAKLADGDAGEPDRVRVLEIIREHRKPEQNVFVGVISPIDSRIETAEEVRDRTLGASKCVPIERSGTALAIGRA